MTHEHTRKVSMVYHKWRMLSKHHYLLVIVICSLLLLAAACGPGSPTTPTHVANVSPTATSVTSPASTPPAGKPTAPSSGTTSTVSMPPTQTDCPLPLVEAARPAVMRPLALGNHANIAYIFNEGTSDNPSFGELKRYDVTTGNKTTIVHVPKANISSAQVSADGQWLLFVSDIPGAASAGGDTELQLVRMDGQGLQTLLCAAPWSLTGVQWSPDQKFVVFSVVLIPGNLRMYLLNLATGVVQTELSYTDISFGYVARTWLDNTRVYVIGIPNHTQAYLQSLYILDTKKGPNQHEQDLQQVIAPTENVYCWDFDSDYAATKLITSQCSESFPNGPTNEPMQVGPSNITVHLITGGPGNATYTNSKYAITQVRMLGYTSNSLLQITENQSIGNDPTIDTSENGLWKMNTDSSGMMRLTTEAAGNHSNFNRFTQYPWSNVSFDGTMYALQVNNILGKDPITNLYYGSLSGGSTTSFAFAHANSEMVEVAGWTLM